MLDITFSCGMVIVMFLRYPAWSSARFLMRFGSILLHHSATTLVFFPNHVLIPASPPPTGCRMLMRSRSTRVYVRSTTRCMARAWRRTSTNTQKKSNTMGPIQARCRVPREQYVSPAGDVNVIQARGITNGTEGNQTYLPVQDKSWPFLDTVANGSWISHRFSYIYIYMYVPMCPCKCRVRVLSPRYKSKGKWVVLLFRLFWPPGRTRILAIANGLDEYFQVFVWFPGCADTWNKEFIRPFFSRF